MVCFASSIKHKLNLPFRNTTIPADVSPVDVVNATDSVRIGLLLNADFAYEVSLLPNMSGWMYL